VQLPGFFIELLTVAEPDKLGEEGIPALFGRFNQSFLDRSEGFSLLILESRDAAADAADFAGAKIGISDAMRFERTGKRPDGSEVTVAFSLAFARDARAPDCGFAVCQQHFPENFWNPAFQRHANAVTGVGGVVLVADNPSDHHIFLSAFAGERELQSSSSGITMRTPRGDIQVMTPVAYRGHFDAPPPDVSGGARLAALRLLSSDLAATGEALAAGGFTPRRHRERLVVGPQKTFGAALVFEGGG
jgi:hypothetical protein